MGSVARALGCRYKSCSPLGLRKGPQVLYTLHYNIIRQQYSDHWAEKVLCYITLRHYSDHFLLGPGVQTKISFAAASSQKPANNNQQQVGGWVSKWLSGWHCMMQYMGEWHYMLCCAAWCYIICMVDARGRHPDYVLLLPFVLLVFMLCCVMLYYVMLLCIMLYNIMVCYNG